MNEELKNLSGELQAIAADLGHTPGDSSDRVFAVAERLRILAASGVAAPVLFCAGTNCKATAEDFNHSPECEAEHNRAVHFGAGSRHPDMRYLGYTGEPLPQGVNDDQRAAWDEGRAARVPAPSQPVAADAPAEVAAPVPKLPKWMEEIRQVMRAEEAVSAEMRTRLHAVFSEMWDANDAALAASGVAAPVAYRLTDDQRRACMQAYHDHGVNPDEMMAAMLNATPSQPVAQVPDEVERMIDDAVGLVELPPIRVGQALAEAIQAGASRSGQIVQAEVRSALARAFATPSQPVAADAPAEVPNAHADTWSEYVAGMVLCYLDGKTVDESQTKAVAGIIRRRLCRLAAPVEVEGASKFARVPLRMTLAMQRVVDEEDWEWRDLLAAAEAVTEEEYDTECEDTDSATIERLTHALAGRPAPAAEALNVDALMEQAQVFASAWSLVGGRFDNGSALDDANEAKAELRAMLTRPAIPVADPHAQACENLLAAAQDFFREGGQAGVQGAVRWVTFEDGSLVIYTRGEYRETLLANIHDVGNEMQFTRPAAPLSEVDTPHIPIRDLLRIYDACNGDWCSIAREVERRTVAALRPTPSNERG